MPAQPVSATQTNGSSASIDRFADTAPLVQALAAAATRLGNDPHDKYGDRFECGRRFGTAMGIASLQ